MGYCNILLVSDMSWVTGERKAKGVIPDALCGLAARKESQISSSFGHMTARSRDQAGQSLAQKALAKCLDACAIF